jgi:diguanylate cyclase (GGDEF)-like protein
LSGTAYRALSEAATSVEGTRWVPSEHPVCSLPEVSSGLVAMSVPAAPGLPVGSVLWAPMVADDGSHLGFVSVCPGGDKPPGPAAALLLEVLAEIAALSVERRGVEAGEQRSAAKAEAHRRQLEDLIAASLEVRGEAALDDVLADIARAMVSGVGFKRAAIYLLQLAPEQKPVRVTEGFRTDQGHLAELAVGLVASVGIDPAEAERLRGTFTSLAGFAPLMRAEMRMSRSFLFDHRFFELHSEFRDKLSPASATSGWVDGAWHAEDSLTVPLEDRQGNLLGVISMDEPLNRALPTKEDCRALEFFADQCALAVTESRRLEAALEDATTDDLTGLANRRALLQRAPQLVLAARRSGSTCSALYIDIDHFKDINDSFGHSTGDEVIAAVGRTIAARLRRGDLVARYGGEEFVALLPDTGLDEAVALAEEIRRMVATTDFVAVNPPIQLHVSVGVAVLGAGDDTHALLAAADAALYAAKRSGRDRVCIAAERTI